MAAFRAEAWASASLPALRDKDRPCVALRAE
jgi:hypothetical protein